MEAASPSRYKVDPIVEEAKKSVQLYENQFYNKMYKVKSSQLIKSVDPETGEVNEPLELEKTGARKK